MLTFNILSIDGMIYMGRSQKLVDNQLIYNYSDNYQKEFGRRYMAEILSIWRIWRNQSIKKNLYWI